VEESSQGIKTKGRERRGTKTLFIFYYSTHGENTEKESLHTTCTVIKCGIIYVFLVIVHTLAL
jgi:hypothetical protein